MKRAVGRASRKVQSENVRRVQQTGRRQAANTARRVTRYLDSDTGQRRPDDVSIAVPGKWRRYFALSLVLIILVMVVYAFGSNIGAWQGFSTADSPGVFVTDAPGQIVNSKRIGLVSGHRGNDSGTVCADGLTEAEVNYDITTRVADQLIAEGYSVDILDEFDDRLKRYKADALLSIHADSCQYINELATGFKVARVQDSRVPEQEDRLVACVTEQYRSATGLRFHANTVTFDMTRYHAFYEIDATTPAAIIETGFLNLDRAILVEQPDVVAKGIVDGLRCFIEGETSRMELDGGN